MYNRGDYVRCKVLNYSDHRLNLTIEPDVVNSGLSAATLQTEMVVSGAVKTKEDHGYTIDLGIDDLNGFVKTDSIELSIGQSCLFKIISKGRAISLSVCQGLEIYDVANKSQFDIFLPGARLINCTVEKVGKNGLHLNVAKQINGYVHINHLPAAKRASLIKSGAKQMSEKAYSNGDKLSATIIFVNPYSRIVYLSLLPHLNDSNKSPKVARLLFAQGDDESHSLQIGQIIENAQVVIMININLFD